MKITIQVYLDGEFVPGATNSGRMEFREDATLENAGFETVSKVFARAHELLDALKRENLETVREKNKR